MRKITFEVFEIFEEEFSADFDKVESFGTFSDIEQAITTAEALKRELDVPAGHSKRVEILVRWENGA